MKKITKRTFIFALLLNVFLIFGCSVNESNIKDLRNLPFKDFNQEFSENNQMNFIDQKYFYSKMDTIKPTDEIGVIVTMSRDSLLDRYNKNQRKYQNVSQLLQSGTGKKMSEQMREEQDLLIQKLLKNNIIKEVKHNYTTLLNGFYARIEYQNLSKLEKYSNVEQVMLSDVYSAPKATIVKNNVQVYDTGIFDSSDVKYTGANTSVAVLDSGFDTEHQAFLNMPNNPIFTKSIIDQKLKDMVSYSNNDSLLANEVFYNSKVPYAYDYADNDSDVSPYDSKHGTHVASIIGGKDDKITGVAVDTQLVLLKVFSDYQEGAEEGDILAALEDAVILNVDAINMSLGTSCGFMREVDRDYINLVYDKIQAAGISLVVAASNDYSSAFGGELGNTNKTLNPDSATVGAPSTYAAALSVASINGQLDKYILGNDDQAIFFNESANSSGKDYDFFKMLNLKDKETLSFDYVTVPGVGLKANYQAVDAKNKIALVKRGDISFEEKAKFAYEAGAIACIVYNNIFGDIKMTLGNNLRIPTISITKDDGDLLAKQKKGTLKISNSHVAGPFMSDFSSWGPTPSLNIKPEITAHGGNITAAVPGGGYDSISGTSMASPNMCGIIILIRQYVKENLSQYASTPVEVTDLVNQLCMSTTNIAYNQKGNPYSPRKQGAGLASLYNAVNTKAFLTVPNQDRPKIELMDDPEKTGKYNLKFNIHNMSSDELVYEINPIIMTESVSTSDDKYVSELSYLLKGLSSYSVVNGTLRNNQVSVSAKQTAEVTVEIELTKQDKAYLNKYFKNGMYVEGFVNLLSKNPDKIDLNVPYLAFFGKWDQAPMFDKTYYEVDPDLQNDAIDEEDKLKADYYKTTPLGKYYQDYIIPLGTYVYKIDTSKFEPIVANTDKAALSYDEDAISGIYAVYAGLLRNAKEIRFTVTNSKTQEIVYEKVSYNNLKAHYNGGVRPSFEELNILPEELNLENNVKYDFKMEGKLDYDVNENNLNNRFEFSFYVDYEAPNVTKATYHKEYDKVLKKDRYYVTLTVHDNQYVQAIRPSTILNQKLVSLSDYPIPVYGNRNEKSVVKIEITDYLEGLKYTEYPNTIFFAMDDYAMNTNIFMVPLDQTANQEIQFTQNSLDLNVSDEFDLTTLINPASDYYRNLKWTSANPDIVRAKDGFVEAMSPGKTIVTAESKSVYGESKDFKISIEINVTEKNKNLKRANNPNLEDVKFIGYDTLFAFLDDNDPSEIGNTGERNFFDKNNAVSFYPSEKIKILVDLKPWNLDLSKYEMVWTSSNPRIATVSDTGEVLGLKEGTTNITLKIKNRETGKFSNIQARCEVTIKSEFIVESRVLTGYKGFGGDVVIPEDLGIMFIGPYAFSLYELDEDMIVEDPLEYDKKKIPIGNKQITSIVIPEGVEEIHKYAFYKTELLTNVTLPKSLKIIYQNAFYECKNLVSINLEDVSILADRVFYNCENLTGITTKNLITIGAEAFYNCRKIDQLNLIKLRNTGEAAFENCLGLKTVELGERTKLSNQMFKNTGLERLEIKNNRIPDRAFQDCKSLVSVIIENDLLYLGNQAFENCRALVGLSFNKSCEYIGAQAFSNSLISRLTLPSSAVYIENYAFDNTKILDITFQENTFLEGFGVNVFSNCKNLTKFYCVESNPYYALNDTKNILLNKNRDTIILVASGSNLGKYSIPNTIQSISDGAFSGNTYLTEIIFESGSTLKNIGRNAFAECANLTTINLPDTIESIGDSAFIGCTKLTRITNLDRVKEFGELAFAMTSLTEVTIGDFAILHFGVFYKCTSLTRVNLNEGVQLLDGTFAETKVAQVNMPLEPSILIGPKVFFNVITLKTIDLSKAVGSIGELAFYNCISLEKAELSHVTELKDYAFADCNKLSDVTLTNVEKVGRFAFGVVSEDRGYSAIFKSIKNTGNIRVIQESAFKGCTALSEIQLPNLEVLEKEAFAFCKSLKTVVLGEKLSEVSTYAFYKNEKLESINLEHVAFIGNYAFSDCKVLKSVQLNKVKTFEEGAFFNCVNLEVSSLDEALKVGLGAFANTGISELVLPKVEIIEQLAFMKTKIVEVTLSSTLKKIDKQAFYECRNLKSFYLLEGAVKKETGLINEYSRLDEGVLYTRMGNGKWLLNCYPILKENKLYTVLKDTARIEFAAARYNTFLEHVILPYELTLIGDFAFAGCTALNEVSFQSYIAPTLEGTMTEKIEVSEALMDRYEELFGFSMYIMPYYYYTFKDAVGLNSVGNIQMNYPVNGVGYEAFLYDLYFKSTATTEEVKDENVFFVEENIRTLKALDQITLRDENHIKAIRTAYNKIDFKNAFQAQFITEEMKNKLALYENKIKELRDLANTEDPVDPEEPIVPVEPENPDSKQVIMIIIVSVSVALCLGVGGYSLYTFVIKPKKQAKKGN